jgi:beta-glucanase (GH16 family)
MITTQATRMLALALALAGAGCGLQPPEQPGATIEPPPPPPPPPPDQGGPPPAMPPPGYQLVWSDEFPGTALDPTRWTARTGPRRDGFMTPDAVTVAGGILTLTTSTEDGRHESGFLDTDGKFEAKHGYYEARIRFSDAPGSWCAFWLQSPTVGRPLGDPATAGVEIDVVEHRVTDQGGQELADAVALNINWDGYGKDKKNIQRVTRIPGGAPVQGAWHDYGVLWTPSEYTFFVDAVALWSVARSVSQRTEWLQLTCEVEDGTWAGFVPDGGYGPRATSTARMEVDWVRVWQVGP